MHFGSFIENLLSVRSHDRNQSIELSCKRIESHLRKNQVGSQIQEFIQFLYYGKGANSLLYEEIRAKLNEQGLLEASFHKPNCILLDNRSIDLALIPVREISTTKSTPARNKVYGKLKNILYFTGSELIQDSQGNSLLIQKHGSQVKVSEICYSSASLACVPITEVRITVGDSYLIGQTIFEIQAFEESSISINIYRYFERSKEWGKSIKLTRDNIIIGRNSPELQGIQDINMSKYHARISKEHGGWVIKDLESKNGTMKFLLNSLMVDPPNQSSPSIISNNDQLLYLGVLYSVLINN